MSSDGFHVEIYSSRKPVGRQKWRWRVLSAANGKIVATSGEAYTNQADCEEMAHKLFPLIS